MGGVSGFPGLLIALMISDCVFFFAIIRKHKNEYFLWLVLNKAIGSTTLY